MGSILALFVLGVLMDSRLQLHLGLEDPLALLFSAAQMGVGAPYVLARLLGYEAGLVKSPTYEYGNTFTAVAGLLNILVLLDALDTARGVRGQVMRSHLVNLLRRSPAWCRPSSPRSCATRPASACASACWPSPRSCCPRWRSAGLPIPFHASVVPRSVRSVVERNDLL